MKLHEGNASQATGAQTLAAAELRRLHHNRCPECGAELNQMSLRNVTLQHCFACKGNFLPEAEFDKLAASRAQGKGVFRTLVKDVLRLFEHKHTS